MYKSLVTVLVLLLCGCASVSAIRTDYAGADAGKVILGIGAATGTSYSNYGLAFRKRTNTPSASNEKPAVGHFIYSQGSIFPSKGISYKSTSETGEVLTQSLPPGEYEIFNFSISSNGNQGQIIFKPKSDFSIPFTVKSGETIYLGNYQANRLTGKNFFGLNVSAGAVFVVTDRLKVESSIAKANGSPSLGAVENATPDPKKIGSPFFVSSQDVVESK